MILRYLFLLASFFIIVNSYSQSATLKGKITDEKGEALYLATISVENENLTTFSNESGYFNLLVPAGKAIIVTIVYKSKISQIHTFKFKPGEVASLDVKLVPEIYELDAVTIKTDQSKENRREVSLIKIDPKLPKFLPSAFNDFNKILVTLPGVSANSELSSQYSVRGGNFDENLVYVNDIEIYRPQLVKSGQQEGLSFINPDLVSDIEFSAGGWQAKYGDKLSSVLAVKYKTPYRFKGSASLSLLGGSLHLENASKNERVSYVIGARQKSSQYLLNTLQTKGEYKPRFFDIQSYITFDFTKRKDSLDLEKRTTLGVLSSYARNKYVVTPATRETSFGTFNEVIKLKVDFDGREILEYDTWQVGAKLSHKWNDKRKTDLIFSTLHTVEREDGDVEGAYSLCDIDTDPNSSQFNQCIFTRGSGTLFDHSRNKLEIDILSLSYRDYFEYKPTSKFQWGISGSEEIIQDQLSEYSFIDSLGYVTVTDYLNTSIDINSFRSQAYAQHSIEPDSIHSLTYGFRINYWSLNNQILFSPRIQYAWKPNWKDDILFKAAIGLYQQPPFYRELRNQQGVLNKNLKAQSSIHAILGSDLNFKAWDRDFKFTAEVYGKYLYNVIPYDVDNVRIRYYAQNNAKAYAAGMDFRVNGEFIKNAESWFSLGFLTTRENVEGDGKGFIRRPTDQRINASIFFQDHIPNNPSLKAYVNLVFGSGLPFGPPNSISNRSAFSAPPYRRVDIGFSKLLTLADKEITKSTFESLWISFEILNVLGVNNTISYLWITDINRNQYAVPNTLSTRFVNLRLVASF
jgi:hypothetical protein